ncbi:hypothetical protein [Tsukamurella soli]|uniref:Uncharacterized protein n=1 Tax=Tsukamurella soli TaxID=644556 RepID=A0ABP8J2K4_9ACTN
MIDRRIDDVYRAYTRELDAAQAEFLAAHPHLSVAEDDDTPWTDAEKDALMAELNPIYARRSAALKAVLAAIAAEQQ